MLTALELEKFKGIGERQRIEFRPLTLLFGPNNAGKSTVLQALLYLHEVIAHGSADVGRTTLGGAVLDLGGFRRLINGHDMDRAITLRAEFATTGSLDRFNREPIDFPLPDLDDDVDAAWLEVKVGWRATAGHVGPAVESATIGVGDNRDPLVWLELTETGPSLGQLPSMSARINLGHSLLTDLDEEARDAIEQWDEYSTGIEAFLPPGTGYGGGEGAGGGLGDGSGYGDGRRLPLFPVVRTRYSALPSPDEPIRVVPPTDSPEAQVVLEQVRSFLEMIVVGTVSQLLAILRDALYIGPLRAIPPRGYLHERAGRLASWADGLAAWDVLLSDPPGLVDATNRWLDRLGATCNVVLQDLVPAAGGAEREPRGGSRSVSRGGARRVSLSRSRSGAHSASVSGSGSSPPTGATRRLLMLTVNGALVVPAELGAGVSQVIPVVVLALMCGVRLGLLEQPELHVHPALQVGLGDLFIETVTSSQDRKALLVETHSEHLILRLLKRIRQTTEKELPGGVKPFSKEQLSVVYVDTDGDMVRIRQLAVDDDGEFIDRWPKGFFEERAEELF